MLVVAELLDEADGHHDEEDEPEREEDDQRDNGQAPIVRRRSLHDLSLSAKKGTQLEVETQYMPTQWKTSVPMR